MTIKDDVFQFLVPNVALNARYTFTDGREVRVLLNCDGLHIDMREDSAWTVEMTFRCWMEMCPASHVVHLELTNDALAKELPRSNVDGLVMAGAV